MTATGVVTLAGGREGERGEAAAGMAAGTRWVVGADWVQVRNDCQAAL